MLCFSAVVPYEGLTGPGWQFLVVYLFFLTLSTVTGNIGNVMVIGALITDKRLRRTGNLFILNLALADLWVTGKKREGG